MYHFRKTRHVAFTPCVSWLWRAWHGFDRWLQPRPQGHLLGDFQNGGSSRRMPCVWMFRLALSGHIYFSPFETPTLTLCLLAPRNTWCDNSCFGAQVSSKYGTWCSERVILQFMSVGCLAGVTYLRYTVLTSPKKDETAVHCCDPALSVLVMLVSRNVFYVVSVLQSIEG